jgi:hypothetical protein
LALDAAALLGSSVVSRVKELIMGSASKLRKASAAGLRVESREVVSRDHTEYRYRSAHHDAKTPEERAKSNPKGFWVDFRPGSWTLGA